MKKLSAQELIFADAVISGNTNSDAYRAAYKIGKMKPKQIATAASKIRKRPHVESYIDSIQSKALEKIEVTAEKIIQELAELGFRKTKDFYDADGNLLPVHKLPDHAANTITEITERVISNQGDEVVIERKYKVAGKEKSLELLGKHLKLFTDKVEHTGKDGKPIETSNQFVFVPVGSDYVPNKD